MGERKALLDQKTELLEKRDTLVQERGVLWNQEMEEGAIAIAAKVDIPSERWTPELKELREVAGKISIMDYFRAAEEGRPANGAAGEYNEHVFGANRAGDFPIEMLHDRDALLVFNPRDWDEIKESENRAAITGTGVNPGSSVNYVMQLFATSEAAFCGASFPAVGVGDHSLPDLFSKPTEIGNFARDAEEGDPGGSLTINTATNRRIQGSMELNSEDENRIPNIAAGLVANLRAALMEELDSYTIARLRAGLTAVAASGTTITLPAFLAMIGGMVDGYAARNVGDVRGLIEHRARDAGDHPECIQSIVQLDSQQRRLPLLRTTPSD